MPSVLLRMPGLNPLRHNAEFDPPHRQPRQSGNRTGCKRRAVIGTDRTGHAVLAKSRFEYGLHPYGVGLLHRLATQQVAAAAVRDGERVYALAVAGSHPALAIPGPLVIGLRHG